MNSKHTPGPWHVGMRPGPMIYGADSAQVADMRGDLLARDEAAANVRLVVEAPAMLAALRMASRHISSGAMEYSNGDHGDRVYPHDVIRELLARIDGAAR